MSINDAGDLLALSFILANWAVSIALMYVIGKKLFGWLTEMNISLFAAIATTVLVSGYLFYDGQPATAIVSIVISAILWALWWYLTSVKAPILTAILTPFYISCLFHPLGWLFLIVDSYISVGESERKRKASQ